MNASISPKLVFHYAVADNGVIGKDNAMPWHVSSDLKRFKSMTMGKPVIMGRRTFQSIGRALPGRTNIVITRNPEFHADGVIVAPSLEDGLDKAREIAIADQAEEIAVIGGGTIYNALWGKVDRLYVTHVHAKPEGDTCLPAINMDVWQEISREQPIRGEQDSAAMSFAVYDRRQGLT